MAVESVKVATGDSTPTKLAFYVFVAVVADAICKSWREKSMIAPIYIPEGYTLPVFIILIAFAVLAPLFVGWFFKNESKHATEKWTGRYLATLAIMMVLTPSLGLILMSLFTQEFCPDMDPITYIVVLPIVLIVVAYFGLKIMNEGIRAAVDQIKGVKEDVDYAKDELKPPQ